MSTDLMLLTYFHIIIFCGYVDFFANNSSLTILLTYFHIIILCGYVIVL